jgi:exodeoxyribonuclease VII small subunit
MADKEKQEALSLEENFALLKRTVEALEAEDISLEDAFASYSKGMELLKTCNEQIDRVEKQVLVLSEGGELKEF